MTRSLLNYIAATAYESARTTVAGKRWLSFVLITIVFGGYWSSARSQALSPAATHGTHGYEELYAELVSMRPDFTRMAAVQNLSIRRDVARFDLNEGVIYLLTPVSGRTIGAVFLGKGSAHATPPTEIERRQFERFYGTTGLEKNFKVLFLIFADSTLNELQKKVAFSPGNPEDEATEQVDFSLKFLSDKSAEYFDEDIMRFLLEDEADGLFYAHFADRKDDPLCFRINPGDVEEVQLMRRSSISTVYHQFETVCQFHKQADYQSGVALESERKDFFKVIHYNIESTIEENLNFSAVAGVEFTALVPGHDWVPFSMYSDMVVDSAFWEDGKQVEFFKHRNNPTLWVHCDSTFEKYSIRTLKLFYHGDLIARNQEAWIYIKNSTGWYPTYGTRMPTTFELTFHTPAKYTFVSVGKQIASEADQKMVTTRWITPKPIRNASFNLGDYKSYQIEDNRIPPVTVLMAEGGHQAIGQALGRQGILSGKNMEKQVGADVANSIAFYQHVFGPTELEKFYVTETPYSHGLAFPGLIHLAWSTFQVASEKGYDEIFRGHEVAHQWWGIGVDFKTYHDQWLSEGFATYSSIWFMQTALQDNDKFFNILKEYRKAILNNRQFLLGSGQEAGPIWLGYRTSSSETEGDYDLIIYQKGAWVLHMLRSMLIDLRTMKEDNFTNLMRDFFQQYEGKKASTENFRKVVEKHVGQDMGWFFSQWVYGTEAPTYYCSYKVDKRPDGKYLVVCRIRQEQVPDDFKMYMNLKVDFGDKRHAYLRVLVEGADTRVALPLMPEKPRSVEFNALESVLCELKEERWSAD